MVRGVEGGKGAEFQGHIATESHSYLGIEVPVVTKGPGIDFKASTTIPQQCQKEAAKAAKFAFVVNR